MTSGRPSNCVPPAAAAALSEPPAAAFSGVLDVASSFARSEALQPVRTKARARAQRKVFMGFSVSGFAPAGRSKRDRHRADSTRCYGALTGQTASNAVKCGSNRGAQGGLRRVQGVELGDERRNAGVPIRGQRGEGPSQD